MRPFTEDRRAGFTLIELLVVISIIALLVGILLPVLAGARRSANGVICMSNMRGLGVALTSYTEDHEDIFPQPSQDSDIGSVEAAGQLLWFNALDPYLALQHKEYSSSDASERNYEVFKQDPVWKTWDEATAQLNRTIKMNEYFGYTTFNVSSPGSGLWRCFKQTEVRDPAKTVVFIDGRADDTPSVTTGDTDSSGRTLFHVREVYVGLRHDDGANVALVDGSAGHHRNPIKQSGTGYRGWYDNDDPDPENRPDVIFNFR